MLWENIFGVAIHVVLASRYNLLPPANLVPPATKHQNIAAPKGFTNLVPPFKITWENAGTMKAVLCMYIHSEVFMAVAIIRSHTLYIYIYIFV